MILSDFQCLSSITTHSPPLRTHPRHSSGNQKSPTMVVTRSQSKGKAAAAPTPAAKLRKGAKSATKAKPAVSKAKPVASKVVKKAKKIPKKVKAADKATAETTAEAQKTASERVAVPKGQSPAPPSAKKSTKTQPMPVTIEEMDESVRSLVAVIQGAGRKYVDAKPWKPVASTLRTRAEPGSHKPTPPPENASSGSPKAAQRSPNKLYSPVSHASPRLPRDRGYLISEDRPAEHRTNPSDPPQKSPTKHWGVPSVPPENHYDPTSPKYREH